MAKVIGAEGQRALESALRRKEAEEASRDNTTMRSRMALSNNLSSLATDPDVNDPSLAYLSAATMADPTGLAGGIASAFGSVAMVNANKKKIQAGKEQRKANAELVKDKYTKIYGDDFAEAVEGLNPSLASNPDYLESIGKNLGQIEDIQNTRTQNALGISESATKIAQSAATLESTTLGNQIRQAEFNAYNEKKEDYEKQKGPIINFLVESGGMKRGMAEFLASDRNAVLGVVKDKLKTGLDASQRRKLYQSMPALKRYYNEQEFVNLQNIPDDVAEKILQRNIAFGYVGKGQQLNLQIGRLNAGMGEIQANAQAGAIDQLFPAKFTNENGQIGYTDDFKSWFTQFAQGTLNLELDEYDEDDPLDNQFNELSQKYGLTNMNGAIQAYQNTKLSEVENAGEVVQGVMQNDPTLKAASQNLMNLMLEKKRLMEQVPAAMDIPVARTDEEIARLDPGVPFQGKNGGFYITVGNGSTAGSPALEYLNLGQESKRFVDPESPSGSPIMLEGGDTVTLESLKKHNIEYRMVSPTLGVRPMTEQEIKENIPLLRQQNPIPQAPPAKEKPSIFTPEPEAGGGEGEKEEKEKPKDPRLSPSNLRTEPAKRPSNLLRSIFERKEEQTTPRPSRRTG